MKKQFSFFNLLFFVYAFSKAQTLPQPDHVVIVMMENFSYSDIIGNTLAPNINALANDPSTALFTQSYALTHPSQPNYLMLFSGSDQGVNGDVISTNTPFVSCNLAAALIATGKSFAGYSETMPSDGYLGNTSGNYARKHNPWSNWQGSGTNQLPLTCNKTFTSFPTASNYSILPTVCFVVPNLVNDMHDPSTNSVTAITNGDTWFNSNLSAYLQWAKTHNSLLILTWDEDDNTGGTNQIVTLFAGQPVRGGQYNEHIDHYRVLRTLEDMYGITSYCGASSGSSPITDCWKNITGLKEEVAGESNVKVWPVPAGDLFYVEIESMEQGMAMASLCDAAGRSLVEKNFNLLKQENRLTFEVHDLAAGIYFLKLKGAITACKKIVVGN
jgi:hypothetical protein